MASDVKDHENMFLLEVLVDHVTIDNTRLNFDQKTLKRLGEACVMFQFLNYPPLVVCQEDFGKRSSHYGEATDIKFNSGKSCLFSFRSHQMAIPERFQIQVSVIRRVMSLNGGSGKKTIATTNIDLGEDFASLMRISRISVIDSATPLFQTKADTYALRGLDGTVVGELKVFVRLSCFGQYIVTQIQMGQEESYLFKGTEHSEISKIPGDKTKKPVPQIDTSRPCPPPRSQVPSIKEERKSQTESIKHPERTTKPKLSVDMPRQSELHDRQRLTRQFAPEQEILIVPPDVLGQEMARQMQEMLLTQFPLDQKPSVRQKPAREDAEGDYKEITAEVKGHTIRIRVPRRKKDDDERKRDAVGPVCKYAPKLNVCDCNYPIPPELIPRCPVPRTNCGCR